MSSAPGQQFHRRILEYVCFLQIKWLCIYSKFTIKGGGDKEMQKTGVSSIYDHTLGCCNSLGVGLWAYWPTVWISLGYLGALHTASQAKRGRAEADLLWKQI